MDATEDREPALLNDAAAIPRSLLWRRRLTLLGARLAWGPLVAGGLVMLLWLALRWAWLGVAGLFIVTALRYTIPAALLALGAAFFLRPHEPDATVILPPRLRGRRLALWALVAVLNIPAAAACLMLAVHLITVVRVELVNACDVALTGLVLDNATLPYPMGDIAPGGRGVRRLGLERDSSLVLRGRAAREPFELELLSYTTGFQAGELVLEIHPAAADGPSPMQIEATIVKDTVK